MQIVNGFNIELEIKTYNVGDFLEWIAYATYRAPPHSTIYVKAHDHGRCKVHVSWAHGGRETEIHSENDILAFVPPPPKEKREKIEEMSEFQPDEVTKFLRENQELIRFYHLD